MTDGREAQQETAAATVDRIVDGDRALALGFAALLAVADERGHALLDNVALSYRDLHRQQPRDESVDGAADVEALSLDDIRAHLKASVLPRLAARGGLQLVANADALPNPAMRVVPPLWHEIRATKSQLVAALRHTGEHPRVDMTQGAPSITEPVVPSDASVLGAEGLVKVYRGRKVVNDVALQVSQGEIVGLLGPNGAGKTTTFYMLVGLIAPQHGKILLDGKDITSMPMYKRARQGIGYLSQEPSVFRKLTVEENILAILETLPLTAEDRKARLESLLNELNIAHLRNSKAFQLSGGERRRLEITRALVTQPKFMMLDEPFAGVDPIAVHDIQSIVAELRHRGIGVLISDHNVEQTLDIVDRAYIMFDGSVKVSGTVRELVFDETVAEGYLGPTLAARLRARFSDVDEGVAVGGAVQ
jgi:lipopolysaccharide export system ATP-binding protein